MTLRTIAAAPSVRQWWRRSGCRRRVGPPAWARLQVNGYLCTILKCILLLWGWDHSFTEYIKYEIGWESWEQLIFPWSKEMLCIMLINFLSWTAIVAATVSLAISSAGLAPYELAIVITLLGESLIACCVVKCLANHAKALLEAKAFAPRAIWS